VDRNTIATLRKVARDGAIAALTASTSGRRRPSVPEASDLAKLKAEVEPLGGVIIEQAVGHKLRPCGEAGPPHLLS